MLMMQFDTILKHVQTFHMLMMRFDTILKHVQTCQNTMIQFDTILQTCSDLSQYYNIIINLSELVLNYNITKFSEIQVNGTQNADNKAIPWTASTSERSKTKN